MRILHVIHPDQKLKFVDVAASLNISAEYTDEIPTIRSQKRRYTVNLYRPQ